MVQERANPPERILQREGPSRRESYSGREGPSRREATPGSVLEREWEEQGLSKDALSNDRSKHPHKWFCDRM